jgi:hypothetical protein
VGCRCLVGLMVLYNNTCCAMANPILAFIRHQKQQTYSIYIYSPQAN